jgi:hypothetical protein
MQAFVAGAAESTGAAGPWRRILTLATVGLFLSGCGLHVSKNGVSGNIMGHSFSGATGALPAGFPSQVPVPDTSRVLAGGGADNRWDAAFAVTGSLASGTTSYEDKFRSMGYTVANVEQGSSPIAGGAGSGSTTTTVAVSGSVFSATNPRWTVQVESRSTTSSTGSGLKPGEFAVNVTVVPTSTIATSTT